MATLDHARERLAATQAEVGRLKESEFPYSHPREVLELLEGLFAKQQAVLEKVSPTAVTSVVHNACSTSLYQLFVYVPVLGFILRATNVRNAFEWYAPLLRLARIALKPDVKLIISSEWDYSPFVYRAMTDLPGFVLIGLPAPESSNPLLLPLAGHEMGHSLWESKSLANEFAARIETGVLDELTKKRWIEYSALYPQYKDCKAPDLINGDLFVRSTWVSAFDWCSMQAEEVFCDCFGLRLFAESYLHAFAYLLAPGTSGRRSLHYPTMQRRISHMLQAAGAMGITVSADFAAGFEAETDPTEPATKLLVSIADEVSTLLVPDLIKTAKDAADARSVPSRDAARVADICREFEMVIPTGGPQALTDIVNAAWQSALKPKLWDAVPQIKAEDRDRVLGDLVLKSMEVSEVISRTGRTP